MEYALVVLAALMGAAGIVLAAAGAHGHPGAGLESAGHMLLFHAAAILGGVALIRAGLPFRPLAGIALFALFVGAALFAGDVAARAYLGSRLFPMAAPAGGMVMIAGWLILALAALIGA